MDKLELIKHAVLKEGFLLEKRAAKIFEDNGFKATTNSSFQRIDPKEDHLTQSTELDVWAMKKHVYYPDENEVYFAECKGGPSDDELILILDEAKNNHSVLDGFFSNTNDKGRYIKHDDHTSKVWNDFQVKPLMCFTGDFFQRKDKEYKKKDSNTNIFRAIGQLMEGIDGFFYEYIQKYEEKIAFEFFPVLITNIPIRVARFNLNETEKNKAVEIASIPWALCKNNSHRYRGMMYLSQLYWYKRNMNKIIHSEKYFPYVWIIHIDSLAEFIKSTDKSYTSKIEWR